MIKMLIVIAAVYALFTLPYHVTWLCGVFGYPNSVAKKLCVLLVIATSAAHPIIYGTLNQEFAKGFKAFFRCLKTKQLGETRQKTFERRVKNKTLNKTYRFSCPVTSRENGDRELQPAKNEPVVQDIVTCL